MTITHWVVVAAGLLGICLVNWYFFVAGKKPGSAQ